MKIGGFPRPLNKEGVKVVKTNWLIEAPDYDLKIESTALYFAAAHAAELLGPQLSKLITLNNNPFPCEVCVTNPAGEVTWWLLDKKVTWQYQAMPTEIKAKRTS